MNKYEQNFKEHLAWLIKAIGSAEAELTAIELTIESIEQDLVSLSRIVTETPVLNELIDTKENQLVSLKRNQEISKTLIEKYSEKMKVYQQICPHEDTVYEYTNQHKNEDYYRCTLCNKLV